MKKILTVIFCAIILTLASGCSGNVDYTKYISEMRSDIYVYEDDSISVKAYCTAKEQPFALDGVRGNVTDVIEIFVSLPQNPKELEVSIGGLGGEMNYKSADNMYYLSFTAPPFGTDSVDVTLTCDGESKTYNALSVKYDGVMSCEQAVLCVAEHDPALFESMTANGLFNGEISVRLLYDDGCYYYVGVCNKEKTVKAYLLDGVKGKIITTRELKLTA